jgi:hypothetical protein
MSFTWPRKLAGLRVVYETGMEHNPMTQHGHSVLTLETNERVVLVNRRAGKLRQWRGRLAPGIRERVLQALRNGGLPADRATIDPRGGILPDSSFDTVTVGARFGGKTSLRLLSYDTAARAPYREALALLESLLRQASGGQVGFGPDTLPPSVSELAQTDG